MQERTKGKTIVYVVDDDLDVREGLKSLFQSMGLKSEAYDSATAFLSAKRPDERELFDPGCPIARTERTRFPNRTRENANQYPNHLHHRPWRYPDVRESDEGRRR